MTPYQQATEIFNLYQMCCDKAALFSPAPRLLVNTLIIWEHHLQIVSYAEQVILTTKTPTVFHHMKTHRCCQGAWSQAKHTDPEAE